jgi:hypothetical protein
LDDQAEYCYITGYTDGDLENQTNNGQRDAYIAKYETGSGNLVWLHLWGGEYTEMGYAIIANGDACYVSGFAHGVPFIAKHGAENGTQEWLQPLEDELDFFEGDKHLAFMPDGDLLVGTFSKAGNFDGQPNAGEPNADGEYPYDIRLVGHDADDGTRLWSKRHGGPEDDFIRGITVDSVGYYHITGNTRSDLGGQTNAGGTDLFTWKTNLGP